MPRRKIKVVRCARCKKRYGAMVVGQRCPHCARARQTNAPKHLHYCSAGKHTYKCYGKNCQNTEHKLCVKHWKVEKRKRNVSLVGLDAALDLAQKATGRKRSMKRKSSRRTNPIGVGDRVQFSASFLRSTGQYTGDVPFAKGRVTSIKSYGSMKVATVRWENYDGPAKAALSNLSKVGSSNPRGVHLPGLGVRYQRMYEKIVRSAKAKRRYGARLKEVAARTVRKFARSNNPADLAMIADVVVGLAGLKYLAAKDATRPNPKRRKISRVPKHIDTTRRGKGSKARRRQTTLSYIWQKERWPAWHKKARGSERLPNNPSGAHLWKKFHGMRSTKSAKVKVSRAFPTAGAWVLGPINYLKVRKGRKTQRVTFGPRARLVGSGKRLLAIANAQFKQHRGVNPTEHGLVPVEVGYEKIAPHLSDGDTSLRPWKHRFGEESGRMPHLCIDHEGFAVIKGGGFHIKADGIHD